MILIDELSLYVQSLFIEYKTIDMHVCGYKYLIIYVCVYICFFVFIVLGSLSLRDMLHLDHLILGVCGILLAKVVMDGY